MITGIVAIAKNFAIGKDGKLPWHHSADLKFFKETTSGNVLVMGSKTWESIGRALPQRLNIILTRSRQVNAPANVLKLSSPEEVVELGRYVNGDLFIIGGAKVFEAFAAQIDKWIVTTVPDEVNDADTFMPPDFLDGFTVQDTRSLGDGLEVKILYRVDPAQK
jgi:dihydrofolate reductase